LLRPCEAETRDGTRLGGCVKQYIPQPAGRWGAVFSIDRAAGKPALLLLAVGERQIKATLRSRPRRGPQTASADPAAFPPWSEIQGAFDGHDDLSSTTTPW
jgi:hypothetical protein